MPIICKIPDPTTSIEKEVSINKNSYSLSCEVQRMMSTFNLLGFNTEGIHIYGWAS